MLIMRQLQHKIVTLTNAAKRKRQKSTGQVRSVLCLVEPVSQAIGEERIAILAKNGKPVLSREEEKLLFRNYECAATSGDKKMMHLITGIVARANLGIVHLIAREFHVPEGAAVEYCDLVQAGSRGILEAIKRFDYRRGCKFSTYAYWWIQAQMQQELEVGLEISQGALSALTKANKFRRIFEASIGREPTAGEVSQGTGLFIGMAAFVCSLRRPLSLDAPPPGTGMTLLQRVTAEEPDSSRHLESKEIAEIVARCIESLDSREANIIRRRFGIGSGKSESLQDIAADFGVSRERIRQLEARAKYKLRKLMERTICDSAI